MRPNVVTLPRFAGGHSGGRPGAARVTVLGAAAAPLVAVALLARRARRVVVRGGSMAPTLVDGDRLLVLARPWGPAARPRVGDIVAVLDERVADRILVKRVAAVDPGAGTVDVLGDAPDASTDSRDFGPVALASVLGRVVYRYGPAARSGPVPRHTEYHRA